MVQIQPGQPAFVEPERALAGNLRPRVLVEERQAPRERRLGFGRMAGANRRGAFFEDEQAIARELGPELVREPSTSACRPSRV